MSKYRILLSSGLCNSERGLVYIFESRFRFLVSLWLYYDKKEQHERRWINQAFQNHSPTISSSFSYHQVKTSSEKLMIYSTPSQDDYERHKWWTLTNVWVVAYFCLSPSFFVFISCWWYLKVLRWEEFRIWNIVHDLLLSAKFHQTAINQT